MVEGMPVFCSVVGIGSELAVIGGRDLVTCQLQSSIFIDDSAKIIMRLFQFDGFDFLTKFSVATPSASQHTPSSQSCCPEPGSSASGRRGPPSPASPGTSSLSPRRPLPSPARWTPRTTQWQVSTSLTLPMFKVKLPAPNRANVAEPSSRSIRGSRAAASGVHSHVEESGFEPQWRHLLTPCASQRHPTRRHYPKQPTAGGTRERKVKGMTEGTTRRTPPLVTRSAASTSEEGGLPPLPSSATTVRTASLETWEVDAGRTSYYRCRDVEYAEGEGSSYCLPLAEFVCWRASRINGEGGKDGSSRSYCPVELCRRSHANVTHCSLLSRRGRTGDEPAERRCQEPGPFF
nr:F-box/kelch-repeat protein At1g80440-like [Ipomoea batatas]